MALVFDNAVREVDQSTTPATDDFLLDATDVVSGHQGFDAAGIANADTVYYEAQQVSAGAVIHREVGIGTWNDTTKTLSRSPIWSTAGALTKASFTLNPNVLVTVAAEAFTSFSQDKAGFVPGPTAADISSNFVLRADGTWVAAGAAGGVSVSGTPVDDQIAIWTGATAIEGVTELTWNDTDKRLTVAGTATPGVILQNTTPAAADDEKWHLYSDINGILRVSSVTAAEAQTAMAISCARDGAVAFGGRASLLFSAVTAPVNVAALSAAPSSPTVSDVYLDDGTNTASGNPGWRRYTGVAWEDIGAAAGGDVTKVGTPVDNQIGVWTGDGTIEGDANLTWDGAGVLSVHRGDTNELAQLNFGPHTTRTWQLIGHGFNDFDTGNHGSYALQLTNSLGGNTGEFVVTPTTNFQAGITADDNAGNVRFNWDPTGLTNIGTLYVGKVEAELDRVMVQGTSSSTASLGQLRVSADAFGPYQKFYKSRGSTGSIADVNNSDLLGGPQFRYYHGGVWNFASGVQGYVTDVVNDHGGIAWFVNNAGTSISSLSAAVMTLGNTGLLTLKNDGITVEDGSVSITETATGATPLTVTSATNPSASTLVVNAAGAPTADVVQFQVGGTKTAYVTSSGVLNVRNIVDPQIQVVSSASNWQGAIRLGSSNYLDIIKDPGGRVDFKTIQTAGAFRFLNNTSTQIFDIASNGDVTMAGSITGITTFTTKRHTINDATQEQLWAYGWANGSASNWAGHIRLANGAGREYDIFKTAAGVVNHRIDEAAGNFSFSCNAGSTVLATLNSSGSTLVSDLTITGDINPEADGTRDLGTQTTAQWANVWSDLINGAEISLENSWRIMESELYVDYPQGFAIGHSEQWETGKSIYHADEQNKQRYMGGQQPTFAVTDEWIEFRGRRITPELLDKLLDLVEQN